MTKDKEKPDNCLCCGRASLTVYRGLCSYCQGTPLASMYEAQYMRNLYANRLTINQENKETK